MRSRRRRTFDADDTQPWLVPPPVPDAPGLNLFGGVSVRWWLVLVGVLWLGAIALASAVVRPPPSGSVSLALAVGGFGVFGLLLLIALLPRRRTRR